MRLDGIKTPFADSINRVAQQRAIDAMVDLGQELPCHVIAVSGQLVTVSFDVITTQTLPDITIPIATSKYDWLPIQVGDRGVTRAADVDISAVSGQGTGTARLDQIPANLSALVFAPVANATWTVPDPTQRVVQGLGGVLLRDIAGTASINVQSGVITLTTGGHTLVINSTGIILDGKVFALHEHTGGTIDGNTGPILP
jgi:hypothetical protein